MLYYQENLVNLFKNLIAQKSVMKIQFKKMEIKINNCPGYNMYIPIATQKKFWVFGYLW